MKTMHTGTDCQHVGDARKKQSRQGICFRCQHPLRVEAMAGNRPLEALGLLLDTTTRSGLLSEPWPRFTVHSGVAYSGNYTANGRGR